MTRIVIVCGGRDFGEPPSAGGRGTADMCRRATAAGLRVISAAP